MKKLHQKLLERSKMYAKWHSHPAHGVTHFLVMTAVGVLLTAGIVGDIHKTQALTYEEVVAASVSTPPSQMDDIAYIRSQIKAKGAKWQADATSVSNLTLEEKKKWVMPLDKLNERMNSLKAEPVTSSVSSTAVPGTFDYRNYNGGNYVSAVKNQGGCGSCWDFGTTAAAETAILLTNKTPFSQNPIDLSEQVMLSCGGVGTCSGGDLVGGATFLVNTGSPVESCYPYTATNGDCSKACANWQSQTYKATGLGAVTDRSVDGIKNALAMGRAMWTGMVIYSDFYSYGSGVYSHVTGSIVGGHVMEVIGYDDASQAFILKNSWGSGWGEAGFVRVAYSELGKTLSYNWYTFAGAANPGTVPSDNTSPVVSLTSPADGSIASGTVAVIASASDNIGVSKVEFYLDNSLMYTDTLSPFSYNWNTLLAANAFHSLTAKAYDAAGNVGASDPITVSVYNVPDTVAPSVRITSPTDGYTIANRDKSLTIAASASDNAGVAKVEFYVDGALKATDTAAPYSYKWTVNKTVSSGAHTLTAKAYDAAGNSSSAIVTVTK